MLISPCEFINMAVQAQYPSNVIFLNRNGQELANDYLLQPQNGGGRGRGGEGSSLDQSHMVFHNGGINPRKRGREVGLGGGGGEGPTPATTTTLAPGLTATATVTANTPPIHPNHSNNKKKQFLLHQSQSQSQTPHQLIDLSQLHHPTPNISTGLRLFSSDHQPLQLHPYPHHHHHHQQQPQQQNLLSEDFASLIKRHRDELDHFLQAQGEELRRTLAEKGQRHYRALLLAAEESIGRRIREKEAEVEKATSRNAELEARAEQLIVEGQVWQAKARAHEAAAASLQAQLQQALVGATAEDGGGVEGQAEDAESAYVDLERETMGSFGCKSCGKSVARVVVLPCRHLCLCPECDQVVQACPVCLHYRNSSIEVFLC